MMTLRDSIEFVHQLEKELCLFNIKPNDPIGDHLASLFETQNVKITTEQTNSGQPTVAVLSNRNGVLKAIDISGLRLLTDDTTAGLDTARPADAESREVLGHLKETTFTSYDQGQLLYASREIEDRARRVGSGTIHAGFQRVSVLHDEQHIYADLAKHGLNVHAYGLPDKPIPHIGSGQVHAVDADEIADIWFVVFDGGDADAQKSALIAEERDENTFYGAWTYDATIVNHLCGYLKKAYTSGRQTNQT